MVPGFIGFLTVPGDRPNENEQNVERDGWALFFDLSYEIVDDLTLSFSGRYSEDNDEQWWQNTYASFECGTRPVVDGVAAPLLPGCELRPDQQPLPIYQNDTGGMFVSGGRFPQNTFNEGSNDSTDFSPRVGINWAGWEDHNLYFTFSQGYRAAGIRVAADAGGRAALVGEELAVDSRSFFDKEQVSSFEWGWKGSFNQDRTYAELALFLTTWEDMQVRLDRFVCPLASGELVPFDSPRGMNCVGGPQPDSRVNNAEEAESKGFEFSIQSLAGENLQLGAFVGYSDAEFKDFKNSAFGDVSGQQLPNAPEWSAGANGQFNWQVGPADAYVRAEVIFRDSFVTPVQPSGPPRVPLRRRRCDAGEPAGRVRLGQPQPERERRQPLRRGLHPWRGGLLPDRHRGAAAPGLGASQLDDPFRRVARAGSVEMRRSEAPDRNAGAALTTGSLPAAGRPGDARHTPHTS